MAAVEVFEEQFLRYKEVEKGKDQLIETLIVRLKELEGGLQAEKLHLEREQETTKAFQFKLHDALLKLKRRDEEIDSNSFVSVLIDGDCMTFLDHFVISAEQGGKDAALSLKSAVCEYVSTELQLPASVQIRIRIYANTKGLASTYYHNNILDTSGEINLFIRGFNMGHPTCDFVDAGDGKECADSKLKACFSRDILDVQCQAVIFGGSADNGYARLLQPFVGEDTKSNKITLIEGPPFAKELAELKNKFRGVARFPNVFRSSKLQSQRLSFSSTPPPSTTLPVSQSYAATLANPAGVDTIRTDDTYYSSAASPAGRGSSVLQNSRGERLDSIVNPSLTLLNSIRYKKHCNVFHILGECSYSNCNFIHEPRLDKKGIEARRWIARQSPCVAGLACRDEQCLLGHQCPEKTCTKIGKGCRFTVEMHNIDRN